MGIGSPARIKILVRRTAPWGITKDTSIIIGAAIHIIAQVRRARLDGQGKFIAPIAVRWRIVIRHSVLLLQAVCRRPYIHAYRRAGRLPAVLLPARAHAPHPTHLVGRALP